MTALLVALAGGVGSVLRYVVGELASRLPASRLPLGTIIINTTGCFVLGLIVGEAQGRILDPIAVIVGTGLIGGYTTFSTAAVEAVNIWLTGGERRRVGLALGHVAIMLALSMLGAQIGLWLR